MALNLNVRLSNGKKFDISVNKEDTVLEVKTVIEKEIQCEPARQRIIYKGRVLKDERVIESYGIENNHAIHVVQSKAKTPVATPSASTTSTPAPVAASAPIRPAASSTTAPPAAPTNPMSFGSAAGNLGGMFAQGGMGGGMPGMNELMQNPEQMDQMMNNPMVQQMMGQLTSNPDFMRSMMETNPQLQALLQANPHMRSMLEDPETLRMIGEAASNPEARRHMMQQHDAALRNIESHPQGMDAIRSIFNDVEVPLREAENAATGTDANAASSVPSRTSNTAPMPDVWGSGSAARPAATNGTAPAAPTGGMPGLSNMFGGMNPGEMPGMMQMLQNNPMLPPQLRENPDLLRRMTSPRVMQAMMQMRQSMQVLREEGLLDAMMPGASAAMGAMGATGAPGGMDMNAMMQQMMGGASGAPTSTAAPPTSASSTAPAAGDVSGMMRQMQQMMGGAGAAGASSSSASVANPEERFAAQLEQLSAMGFTNRQQNIQALTRSNGNVERAVQILCEGI
eukprot:TRINITY_DN777844_c0_g1_i1.p1 TRINITY_DN777844_c0_g1~~TRINITY_DN777844_c0_g1_i1.p1  ORF type:complete len:510 (-),score=223.56 TRINITY_DN777844_c0_g1_i1:127-1656(-)